MTRGPALVDSDTLSELSRGHPQVTEHARRYMQRRGRLTVSAVTIFERLRGYRAALREGKPFEEQLRQFQAFAACCVVVPVDGEVAEIAAVIWSELSIRRRRHLGDILICATAWCRGLVLVTRNRRDFEPMVAAAGGDVVLADWTKPSP
jgi:predicted nucleic acid-binding protein